MSDEPAAVEPTAAPAVDVAQLQAELQRLRDHQAKLLDETKSAKQRAAELEQAQTEAERKSAEEKGEFKSLWEKTQAELERERETARTFQQKIQQRDMESEALKIAASLTRDNKRAELLKKEIMQHARYSEEGVKFELAGIEIKPDQLAARLKEDYPFLVDGSGSTGGGASGGSSGGAGRKWSDMTEQEHVALYKQDIEQYRRLKAAEGA